MSSNPKDRSNAEPDRNNLLRAGQSPTVVVPLDGSRNALVALPVARSLVATLGVTLHVVHVGEPVLPPSKLLHELGLTDKDLHGTVIDQTDGLPAEGITRIAQQWDCGFIVMSTHTGATMTHGELGPVAEGVLRLAPCPVILARPERDLSPWALRRILVPHDGTPTTAAALGPAGYLAQKSGAELLVLHVAATVNGRPVEPGTFAGPAYMDQPQHEWPAWAEEFLERLGGLGKGPSSVKMRLFLAKGEPSREIIRFGEEHDVDLIVLGWRGFMEAERAAVIKTVIRSTLRPVLIKRVET